MYQTTRTDPGTLTTGGQLAPSRSPQIGLFPLPAASSPAIAPSPAAPAPMHSNFLRHCPDHGCSMLGWYDDPTGWKSLSGLRLEMRCFPRSQRSPGLLAPLPAPGAEAYAAFSSVWMFHSNVPTCDTCCANLIRATEALKASSALRRSRSIP